MMRAQGGTLTLGLLAGLTIGLTGGCDALDNEIATGSVRVIPTDTRPAQQALTEPAPISGGTLAVRRNGTLAVAADPDRNVVSLVDLTTLRLRNRVELLPGDEPGRVVIDNGRDVAHVALRRAGAIAAIDLTDGAVLRRTSVCPAPRGMAIDDASDTLYVACADGQLVSLAVDSGAEQWRTRLAVDLRDVVIAGDELLVTRFKSAEVLHVSKLGLQLSKSEAGGVSHFRNGATHDFAAAAAWRAVVAPDGEVVVLHQRAQTDVIGPAPTTDSSVPATPAYYGGDTPSFNCNSIVHGAVTTFGTHGRTATSGAIADAVMPVDVAVSDDAIVIAVAGSPDADAPRPFTIETEFGFSSSTASPRPIELIRVSRNSLSVEGTAPAEATCATATQIPGGQQVTAVAFAPNGSLVSQVREPATLVIRSANSFAFASTGFGDPVSIDLGGESIADTGHDLFHKDAGAGIACASCHMEGGDDGRVWRFNQIGDRRTQAINVGLEGTAPFHWNGDVANIHDLMGEVFVGRMGGVHQSEPRLDTLGNWMFAVQAPTPIRSADDVAAVRGHELFMSSEVGCASCHSGTKFTNNATVAVGTGEPGQRVQVPSLIAVGYRAPFIHTGCAGTLRERFTNTECGGGESHGKTAQLNDDQLDDLVAYLETL